MARKPKADKNPVDPAQPPGPAQPQSKGPFLRVLPVLIVVTALMLTVRINDIRKGFMTGASVRIATELQAQQPDTPKPPATPPKAAQDSPAPPPAAAPPPTATARLAEQGNFSPTEMDVLQKLTERRSGLDVREKDIERREAMMKAAEDQIERKITEMKNLQSTIEGLLRQYNDQEDNKMRSLVKIYENMKPKDAAKIFEQLDMPILMEVIERMKEQKIAPILAEMDPGKARTVTSELAQRRQMPLPKPSSGG
jgi:flagellar motility protein MotE (MotC chaperone)